MSILLLNQHCAMRDTITIEFSRGCFSDLPPDMLKPAENQAFGSKSSVWQQTKTPKVILGRRPFILSKMKFNHKHK